MTLLVKYPRTSAFPSRLVDRIFPFLSLHLACRAVVNNVSLVWVDGSACEVRVNTADQSYNLLRVDRTFLVIRVLGSATPSRKGENFRRGSGIYD